MSNLIWTLIDDSDLPPTRQNICSNCILYLIYFHLRRYWYNTKIMLYIWFDCVQCTFDLLYIPQYICLCFTPKTICIVVYIDPLIMLSYSLVLLVIQNIIDLYFILLMLLVNLYLIHCLWFSFASTGLKDQLFVSYFVFILLFLSTS